MPSKTTLDVLEERMDNHIEDCGRERVRERASSREYREETKASLKRIEDKVDTACDWVIEQKAKISLGKYISGGVGAMAFFMIEKVWK